MNRTTGRRTAKSHKFESQDDVGYLTGQHSYEDREKQIRSSGQRQSDGRDDDRPHPMSVTPRLNDC